MNRIEYTFGGSIPVIAEAVVCVVGGGPGGLGGAVAAARSGRRTVLVEQYGSPGGMAVFGEITPFMPNHLGSETLDRPLYGELIRSMRRYVDPDNKAPEGGVDRRISKDAAMLASEDMLLAEGVRLMYHCRLVDVVMEGRKIKYAVFATPSGFAAVKAEIFIDSTGDGDLAARSNCRFEFGDEAGYCQPMTLCFKMGGVDLRAMPTRDEINSLYDEARAAGEVDNPRENVLWFFTAEPGVVHFNTTRVIRRSAVDVSELSDAEIEGRRQLRQMVEFLRRKVRGFEDARIFSVAHQIGVRESRRIVGCEYLRTEAFENCAKFEGAIARVRYDIDIHNPSGSGTVIRRMAEGEWYEIPYGCIVPADCDNLLIGARCISVDHAIHSSMRIMPVVLSIGQAAGVAASLAVELGVRPGDLDGRAVRRKLVEFGAYLQELEPQRTERISHA